MMTSHDLIDRAQELLLAPGRAPLNPTEAIATKIAGLMREIVAEFAAGSPAALGKANGFFCRTFVDADAAWAECEAFGDDCEALLEMWEAEAQRPV